MPKVIVPAMLGLFIALFTPGCASAPAPAAAAVPTRVIVDPTCCFRWRQQSPGTGTRIFCNGELVGEVAGGDSMPIPELAPGNYLCEAVAFDVDNNVSAPSLPVAIRITTGQP